MSDTQPTDESTPAEEVEHELVVPEAKDIEDYLDKDAVPASEVPVPEPLPRSAEAIAQDKD